MMFWDIVGHNTHIYNQDNVTYVLNVICRKQLLSYSLIFCRYFCFAAGGSFICGCFSLKIDIYILFWILDDDQKK